MALVAPKSKLVFCNIPTGDSDAARGFYSALLGLKDLGRLPTDAVESYYWPISADGIDLRVTSRQNEREQCTCFFAVENLRETVEELRGAGGELVVEPRELRNERGEEAGTMAIMLDPDRNALGLLELEESSHSYFRFGEFREPLRDEQLEPIPAGSQAG